MSTTTPNTVNQTVFRGQDTVLPWTCPDDGTSLDISGWTSACKIRDDWGGTVLLTPACYITDGAARTGEVLVTASQAAFLDPGVYDVQISDPDSGRVITASIGDLAIQREATA